jgi:hypothetical protein
LNKKVLRYLTVLYVIIDLANQNVNWRCQRAFTIFNSLPYRNETVWFIHT